MLRKDSLWCGGVWEPVRVAAERFPSVRFPDLGRRRRRRDAEDFVVVWERRRHIQASSSLKREMRIQMREVEAED